MNKNSFDVKGVRRSYGDGVSGSSQIKRSKVEISADCVLDYENGFNVKAVPEIGGIGSCHGFLSDEMHKSGFILYGSGSMKFGLNKEAVLKDVVTGNKFEKKLSVDVIPQETLGSLLMTSGPLEM